MVQLVNEDSMDPKEIVASLDLMDVMVLMVLMVFQEALEIQEKEDSEDSQVQHATLSRRATP